MTKPRRSPSQAGIASLPAGGLLLEAEHFFDRLVVGTWVPNIDLCETADAVLVRAELPGVPVEDIRLSLDRGVLRLAGVKRERAVASKLLCYYCLERSYGKFCREIPLEWAIDARRAQAALENGILTVELPKIEDRRRAVFEIPVVKK